MQLALTLLLLSGSPAPALTLASEPGEQPPAATECPDPTLGAYMVIRKGQEMPDWVFTFYDDGTWDLVDHGGDLYLSGYWWPDEDDPCLIHYFNPHDNGGKGSEGSYRWQDGGWNKQGGSHPEITIKLVPFL